MTLKIRKRKSKKTRQNKTKQDKTGQNKTKLFSSFAYLGCNFFKI